MHSSMIHVSAMDFSWCLYDFHMLQTSSTDVATGVCPCYVTSSLQAVVRKKQGNNEGPQQK